jgi:two-component system response regulator HydG
MVEEQRFREDLFYRLNVMSLVVPALRERAEDVALLAGHFLGRYADEFKKDLRRFSAAALELLERRPWPGNVRELQNTIERAALLCNGPVILPEHLGPSSGRSHGTADRPGGADSLPLADRSLRAMEAALIRRVLEECGGNRSRAAAVLGINRTTLYNKLKAYGI